MGTTFPMNRPSFTLVPRSRRTGLATGVLCALVLFASSPIIAAHRARQASPQTVQEVPTTESRPSPDTLGWLQPLFLLLGAIWAIAERRRYATMRRDYEAQIQKLQETENHLKAVRAGNEANISHLRSLFREQEAKSAEQASKLASAQAEVKALQARLTLYLEAEPEIEKKATEWAKAREKDEAERRKRDEEAANQRRIKTQTKEKVNALLTSMKRGY